MSPAAEILAEIRAVGAVAYRRGDEVRMRPARAITQELLFRVKRHKAELLPMLPDAPPEVAEPGNEPVASTPESWIVSRAGGGDMRLVVATAPPWTPLVFRAAALVEVLDERTRADRADAHEIAEKLEAALVALRAEGIDAWLTS